MQWPTRLAFCKLFVQLLRNFQQLCFGRQGNDGGEFETILVVLVDSLARRLDDFDHTQGIVPEHFANLICCESKNLGGLWRSSRDVMLGCPRRKQGEKLRKDASNPGLGVKHHS